MNALFAADLLIEKSISHALTNPVPAIQPAVLKQQAALLAEHFDNPAAYIRSLHYLLEFYADRTRRAGQSGKPGPLTPAYRVRPPVLRQTLQELLPLAQAEPAKGLALCDALWEQPYLEFRQLAAMLLGQIPSDPAERITGRVASWITNDLEAHLIEALLTLGLARLRREKPGEVIRLIQGWLDQSDNFQKQLGLRALLPMVNDQDYENLPVFFRLILPLTRQAPPMLRPDLLDILAALAHRSPQETAYFLRQTLDFPDAIDTPWLIRQSLRDFPPELQNSLRNYTRTTEPKLKKA